MLPLLSLYYLLAVTSPRRAYQVADAVATVRRTCDRAARALATIERDLDATDSHASGARRAAGRV